MQSAHPPLLAYAISGVLILVVLYFRMRRMSVKRPLRMGTLRIVPVLFLAITVANFIQFPPQIGDLPWLAVSFALGALLGWQRGKLMHIWAEPESGELMVQGSPWALIFLAALGLFGVMRVEMALRGLRLGKAHADGSEA